MELHGGSVYRCVCVCVCGRRNHGDGGSSQSIFSVSSLGEPMWVLVVRVLLESRGSVGQLELEGTCVKTNEREREREASALCFVVVLRSVRVSQTRSLYICRCSVCTTMGNTSLIIYKCVFLVVIFCVTVVSFLLPMHIRGKWDSAEFVLVYLNCLAGGFFLGAGFLHMLPDSAEVCTGLLVWLVTRVSCIMTGYRFPARGTCVLLERLVALLIS